MIKGELALLRGRNFQLWDYWVSHSQLLIRSPYDGQRPNIDLRVSGVDYLDLAANFSELNVLEATESEREVLKNRLGRDFWGDDEVFALSCEGRRYYIVAAHLVIEENWHSYLRSSLDYPWNSDPGENSIPPRLGDPELLEQTRGRWAALSQLLSAKIVAARDDRPGEGMGAREIALLLDDCLSVLSEKLADASQDNTRRGFSLLENLLEDLLRPNAREKALLERSALLVRVQYEFDRRRSD